MKAVVRRCSENAFNFIKKETLAQVLSCEFCEISKNTFFYRTSPVAASVTYNNTALTWRKGRWILLSAQTVSWSIVKHMVSLTYFPQKHELKVFRFLLGETGMAFFQRLFYATSVVSLMLIFSFVCFVVDCVAKLVLFVLVDEGDDSPVPTLRSSLLSPLLPPPLILGSSLTKSCVTDGYWLSSISHFAMFTRSINDCIISFRDFTIHHSREYTCNRCLYSLNELIAWQFVLR